MPTKYERSLIRMGKGGLVISLPKSLVCYYGLKPGDRLEVIANDELTINPIKKQPDK